jgi:RimJ/RimL family protein N-acetyltransferase
VQEALSFRGVAPRLDVADGVVVRTYDDADLPKLVEVVNRDLESLRPWMPWAQAPVTLEQQREWWQGAVEMWRAGTGFTYGVFLGEDVVGGTGFHVRNGPGVLEIGYWLDSAYWGRGIMTNVTRALTEHAGTVPDVTAVEIHCDVANVRSAAIPQRLGYRLVDTRPVEVTSPGCVGREQIWRLELSSS